MSFIEILRSKFFNNKFSKDSIWIFSSQAVLATNGILLNIFISNYYSTELLGVFNQALSFFLILSAVSNFGLFNTTVKFVAEKTVSIESIKKIVSANFILAFIFSVLIILIIWAITSIGVSLFSSVRVLKTTKIVFLALPVFTINRIFMGYFNGIRNMKIYSFIRIFRWVSYIIIFAVISIITNNFYLSVYAFFISEILLLLIIVSKYHYLFSFKIEFSEVKRSLSFGSKSFLSEIVSYSQDRLDIIIVGYILSETDVGVYSFAASIAKGILIIPAVFMQNVNPIISKLWIENKINEIQGYIDKLKRASVKIMIPFVLLVIVMYNTLVNFFMPTEFNSSTIVFLILLLGAFILSIISWSGGFLLMAGKLYPNLLRVISLLFISALLNLIFTNYFGLLGAASAYLIFTVFVIVIQNWFLDKFMNIKLVGVI